MTDHPSHKKQLHRLNRIIGQLEGVKKMIEQKAYCPDILTQTKAVRSAIKSTEALILEEHIRHCVTHAAQSKNQAQIKAKVQELVDLFKKN